MNGFNIPMPEVFAGASPSTLGSWGNILGGAMGGGQGATSTGVPPEISYLGPEVVDAYLAIVAMGYDAATFMEGLNYQAKRDDADREYNYYAAELSAQSAENTARIAADRYTEAASIGAEADMYAADQALRAAQEHAAAARYAADQALQGVREQEANRLKIAAAELKLKAQQVASEELGAPSDWRKQVGFLRGMGMTQENITPQAIRQTGESLGPVDPNMLTPGTPPPQAVVGEAGPELATATPQGTQITPLTKGREWWLKKQMGVPGMQYGGQIGYTAGDTSRADMGLANWQRQKAQTQGAIRTAQFGMYPTSTPYNVAQSPHLKRTWWENAGPPQPAPGSTSSVSPSVGPGGEEPIAGEGTTTGEPPYLDMLRRGANVPLWQAWTGPRTKPEVGMDIPIKMPHEINYGDFLRLTPTEQQMAFADWEALGMAPDTAFMIMQRSAMRGTGRATTAYG